MIILRPYSKMHSQYLSYATNISSQILLNLLSIIPLDVTYCEVQKMSTNSH
jgi:hypothetical protein